MTRHDEVPNPHAPTGGNEAVGKSSATPARGLPPWTYWLASSLLATVGIWLLTRTGPTYDSHNQPAQHPGTTSQANLQPSKEPTSRSAASASPSPAGSPSAFPTSDPLAGAIPDSLIQRYLDDARLTNVPPATADKTRTVAWKDLAADLRKGGWSKLHLQASATTAAGTNTTAPIAVDVTIIWSATDPAGQFTDRRQSIVRLLHNAAGTWATDRIS